MDPADWPPGCESDAGYYGVRVGESVGLVSPAAMRMGPPLLSDSPHAYIDCVLALHSAGHIDVWQTRELLGARPIPGNHWRKYGLNAREYGWNLPRGRA